MTVDLNTCVPKQQCITADGRFLTYLNKLDGPREYPHLLLDQDSGEETFTNDGTYDIRNFNGNYNIVRIIPMESTTLDKHPSVAWWESCPWITDRTPTEEDCNAVGWVMAKLKDSSDVATVFGPSIALGQPWIHRQDWQPPVLSNKEKALELLNKHKDGVTMCVWIPTSEDWTTIRKGLEE